MQGRTRSILEPERNGGRRCEGDPLEMRNCNMQPCQSKFIQIGFICQIIEIYLQ